MALLVDRLRNWGAYCRHDDAEHRSVVASFWAKWIPHKAWDSGWGDAPTTDESTTSEIDEQDAERIDAFVRQLPRHHRAILTQRYVLRSKVDRLEHDAAVRALADLMDENIVTVRAIRVLLRGGVL